MCTSGVQLNLKHGERARAAAAVWCHGEGPPDHPASYSRRVPSDDIFMWWRESVTRTRRLHARGSPRAAGSCVTCVRDPSRVMSSGTICHTICTVIADVFNVDNNNRVLEESTASVTKRLSKLSGVSEVIWLSNCLSWIFLPEQLN